MIGNRTYTVDEINEFLDNTNFDSQQRAALAGLINAANNGETIKYDPNAKTFGHKDIHKMFAPFFGSERRASRNAPGKSINWSNRQARKNSDFHIVNSAIHNFGQIVSYFKKKEEDEKKKTIDGNVLYKLNHDPDGFYTYDKDGKVVYADDDPYNATSKSRYEAIIKALKEAVEGKNLKDIYNFKEWDESTWNQLVDWYKGLKEDKRQLYDPENMWTRVQVGGGDGGLTVSDRAILKMLGAKFDDSKWGNSGSKSEFYLPENTDSSIEAVAKAHGVKFESTADGRDKLVDPTGQYYHMMGRGVPFLATTPYSNGYIGKDGLLYTWDEVNQGEKGPVGATLNDFFSAADSNAPITDWMSGVTDSGIRTYLNFDDKSKFAHVLYDPSKYAIDGIWSDSDWESPMYIRDDSGFYNSTNPNFRVINYLTDGYEYGFPMSKFRVMYKDSNGKIVVKDYDNEESMLNDGMLSIKDLKRTPKSSKITMFDWEHSKNGITARQYAIFNNSDVIMKGVDGKFYYKRNNNDGSFNLVLIDDENKLNDILKNPGKYKQYSTIENALKSGNNSKAQATPQAKAQAQALVKTSSEYNTMLEKNGGVISKNKNGGTISKIKPLPKFVTGGPIRSSVKTESSSEGAETSVSQTHSVKRDEGIVKDIKDAWEYDFTDAEKWQIRGAITDLAGVALSFIPGAHYVSAATGLGGTLMTFAGDVKKDGLDWGDVERGLFSAAMDVGTVFTGGIAKTAKVVKALKAAAQPIMKLFTLYGITNGAAAFAKMARGEDVTSEDLIDILRGLTSTAIGAKMFKQKVGDATLSKKIEDEVLKTQNANLKKVPEAKIGDTKIKLTEAEVNANVKGKTKAEVEEYLKGKVKEKLGDAFDETKHAQDLSSKFGIEYDKGEFDGLKWSNLFKGKGFVQRGNAKAIFNPEEVNTGHSWLGHYFRPGVRNANLGYDRGFWKKEGRLGIITPDQYAAAQRMVTGKLGTFYNRWAAQSLLQQSVLNPSGFKFKFEDEPVQWRGGITGNFADSERMAFSWGRPVYGRKPIIDFYDQLSPTKGVREAFIIGPDGNPLPPRVLEAPVQGPIRNLNPEREIIRIGFDGKPVYADEIVTPKRATNISQWVDLYHNRNDYYKSGGKIQFAKGGKKIKKCKDPDNTGIPGENDVIDSSTVTATYTPKQSGNLMGTWTPPAKPNVTSLFTGLAGSTAKIGANIVGLSQQKNNVDKIRPVSYTPETEYYTSFKNPHSQFFENEAKRAESRTLNPISSDPLRNRAFRKDSAETARNIRMQGAEHSSKLFDQFNNTLMKEKRQYAENRAKIANLEAQQNQQMDATKAAYDSQYVAENIKNVGQYVDDVATQWSNYAANKNSLKKYEFDYDYSEFMRNAQSKFDEAKAAGGDNFTYKDVSAYIQGTPELKSQYDNFRKRWSSLKKGGKVRPVEEQIKIDTERSRDKAILQLSKQAHDLLKTLLS